MIMFRLLFIIFSISSRYPEIFEPQSSPHIFPSRDTSEKDGTKFLKIDNLNNSALYEVTSVTNEQLGGKNGIHYICY